MVGIWKDVADPIWKLCEYAQDIRDLIIEIDKSVDEKTFFSYSEDEMRDINYKLFCLRDTLSQQLKAVQEKQDGNRKKETI